MYMQTDFHISTPFRSPDG